MKIFILGFYLVIIAALFPSVSTAQITVQKVLNLFSKNTNKKQQPTITNSQQTTNTNPQIPDNNATDKNTDNGSYATPAPNGLKAGDVAPDAVYIDADALYPFNDGAAVVKKGDATALIDKTGKFLVPYNRYKFDIPPGFSGSNSLQQLMYLQSGIFLINRGTGAFNSKGVLITKGLPDLTWGFALPDGQIIWGEDQNHNYIYLDEEGNKYNIQRLLHDYRVNEGIMIVENRMNKIGYKNLKDEWLVQPIYDAAQPFSDGLACVGKKDEFGEMKYGFINKKGQVVIPFNFSNQPSDFNGGLAKVIPKDISEFMEAYIDKKGNIVQKFSSSNLFSYIGNGYYYDSGGNLMDSTGKIVTGDEFLKNYGFVLSPSENYILLNYARDGKMYFSTFMAYNSSFNGGYVDIKTKKIMDGAFESDVNAELNFSDRESKLSFARFYTSNIHDQAHLREGYINEDGVFVIVRKAASVF